MVSPNIQHALRRTRTLYLTTYSSSGKSGTVPIWFFEHQGMIFFCTQRDSLKARRMRRNSRVMVHIGRRTGPQLACMARLVEDDLALQALLVRTYRKRYWLRWLFLGPRLRRGFASGEEVLVQLTPQTSDDAALP